MTTSKFLGIWLSGAVSAWRDSVSSDFFFGRRKFPWSDNDGGQPWFSCLKNSSRSLIWQEMYILEKREQSLFIDDSCWVALDDFLEDVVKKLSLFLVIGSERGFFFSMRRSEINVSHCSFPRDSMWRILDTADSSAITFVLSVKRSPVSSKKGFPKSSTAATRDFTSLKKETWKLLCSSWCLTFSFVPVSGAMPASNSLTSLAISGPDSIHRRRAFGFSVRPTDPPSPFTIALFCSCAWSMAIEEKRLRFYVHSK